MIQTHKKIIQSLILMSVLVIAAFLPTLRADALTASSLLLSDPRTDQNNVTYTFSTTNFTASSIQCAVLLFSVNADGSGGVPSGMDTTGASFSSSTALTVGSWTTDATSNGTIEITSAGQTPSNGNLVFGGIDNGDTENNDYYLTFTTYTDNACTGGNEVDEVTVAFVFTDGELVQLTIDPTLTFSVNTVGSGVNVNGANTTVASTATGINFGNAVTQSLNGISAHALEVGTNATGGYSVYIRHTGDLSNGADSIANHTGTNASPTTFPAAGTEAWGYTTEDVDLTQFGPNEWAGFTTSNEVVAENTSALVGTEITEVGHQVGISSTTPAGTYQTTIIYTVASTY